MSEQDVHIDVRRLDQGALLQTLRHLVQDDPPRVDAALPPSIARGSNEPTGHRGDGDDVRYHIMLEWPAMAGDRDATPYRVELEAQVVKTRNKTFLTIQESRAFGSTSILSTPVQYTVRLDEGKDRFLVYVPRNILVWIPIKMAGQLAFVPPSSPDSPDSEVLLAQHADQVFGYMDQLPDSQWLLLRVVRRQP